MIDHKAQKVLEEYIRRKNLKHSKQRMQILEIFLKNENHLSAEELFAIVRKKIPSIGLATVYRALRLFCECGICRELKVDDGIARYEHLYGHQHHDHLICTKCGRFVEIMNPQIEKLQERVARAKGFTPEKHRLQIYGICNRCKK